ncbi:hypothetical protein BJ508DRAFT_377164 [Ascobolus immersus RN42]|uniref:Uncharacterized protein n=1 Tax=Ascobolus immersus RN42 TaxID=1160509 RepID=A0A3N4I8G8_ASCIM|nr:hypothetical protein BJ508DRAFT_377164 [Ascobolus immersus RN42]
MEGPGCKQSSMSTLFLCSTSRFVRFSLALLGLPLPADSSLSPPPTRVRGSLRQRTRASQMLNHPSPQKQLPPHSQLQPTTLTSPPLAVMCFEYGSTLSFAQDDINPNNFFGPYVRCAPPIEQAIIDGAYAKALQILRRINDDRAFATIVWVSLGISWKTCVYFGLPEPEEFEALGFDLKDFPLPVWVDYKNGWIRSKTGEVGNPGKVNSQWHTGTILSESKAEAKVYIQRGSIGLHNNMDEAGSMAGFVTNSATKKTYVLTAARILPDAKEGDIIDSPSTAECSTKLDALFRRFDKATPEEREYLLRGIYQSHIKELLSDYVIEDVESGGITMLGDAAGLGGPKRQILASGKPLGKVALWKLGEASTHLANHNEKLRQAGIKEVFLVPSDCSGFSRWNYALVDVLPDRYGGNILQERQGMPDKVRITKAKHLAPGTEYDVVSVLGPTNERLGFVSRYAMMSWDATANGARWDIGVVTSNANDGDEGAGVFDTNEDGNVGQIVGMVTGVDDRGMFCAVTGVEDILVDAETVLGGKLVWRVPGKVPEVEGGYCNSKSSTGCFLTSASSLNIANQGRPVVPPGPSVPEKAEVSASSSAPQNLITPRILISPHHDRSRPRKQVQF